MGFVCPGVSTRHFKARGVYNYRVAKQGKKKTSEEDEVLTSRSVIRRFLEGNIGESLGGGLGGGLGRSHAKVPQEIQDLIEEAQAEAAQNVVDHNSHENYRPSSQSPAKSSPCASPAPLAPSPSLSLESLPPEIIQKIFLTLPIDELVNLSSVNRNLSRILACTDYLASKVLSDLIYTLPKGNQLVKVLNKRGLSFKFARLSVLKRLDFNVILSQKKIIKAVESGKAIKHIKPSELPGRLVRKPVKKSNYHLIRYLSKYNLKFSDVDQVLVFYLQAGLSASKIVKLVDCSFEGALESAEPLLWSFRNKRYDYSQEIIKCYGRSAVKEISGSIWRYVQQENDEEAMEILMKTVFGETVVV